MYTPLLQGQLDNVYYAVTFTQLTIAGQTVRSLLLFPTTPFFFCSCAVFDSFCGPDLPLPRAVIAAFHVVLRDVTRVCQQPILSLFPFPDRVFFFHTGPTVLCDVGFTPALPTDDAMGASRPAIRSRRAPAKWLSSTLGPTSLCSTTRPTSGWSRRRRMLSAPLMTTARCGFSSMGSVFLLSFLFP